MLQKPVTLRTLILNKNYTPASLWSLTPATKFARKELPDFLLGKKTVVCWYPRKVLTPSRDDLYWPSVVIDYSKKIEPGNKVPRLQKSLLYYRDLGQCIFCEQEMTEKQTTIEHIIPRSKGGPNTWDNVGACCERCNRMKGDSLPVGKWKPIRKPWFPTFTQLHECRRKMPIIIYDKQWLQFLNDWKGEVIVKNHLKVEEDEE